MSKSLTVKHSRGRYPIHFGDLSDLAPLLKGNAVAVVDGNLFKLYPALFDGIKTVVIRPGEQSKSLKSYGEALEKLAAHRITRKARLVAVGGGVVGDLGGFLAASYMRGISYVQVPTSLLAMVDSSVGGKVGIDLPSGKNLVGAFWPPEEVLIAPDFLKTLPNKQFVNGMAEVWKYGYIADETFLTNLRKNKLNPLAIVEKCVRLKADIVAMDEFETTGLRATLNFGHTVGHAIEAELGYKKMLHGQAVAIGMVKEAEIGEKLGITPPGFAVKIRQDLAKQGLPTERPSHLDPKKLIERMRLDKKAGVQGISMSLLTAWGASKLCPGVDEATILLTL